MDRNAFIAHLLLVGFKQSSDGGYRMYLPVPNIPGTKWTYAALKVHVLECEPGACLFHTKTSTSDFIQFRGAYDFVWPVIVEQLKEKGYGERPNEERTTC